ncbi:MAG: FG-GAP-like repeat-containing protein [Dysgonamonadaceae bacterium]|jgi:hypothetical protein|nr:FG-GAP-like repeat-containing protein [Dysgonamonadaceae bacterium]
MKKTYFYILSLFFVSSALAHDDIAYKTTDEWKIDFANDGNTDHSFPNSLSGSIATFIGDYNNDGYLDICLVNANLLWNWYLGDDAGNFDLEHPISFLFGVESTDRCLTGDFNGDGKTDIAVVRTSPSNNNLSWYIDYAPCDRFADIAGQTFGLKNDIPLAGDFNADGIDDLCVYRPSEGKWYISLSNYAGYPIFYGPYAVNGCRFGTAVDMPLIGDFNGDGYDDMSLYRPDDNRIYVNYFNPSKPKMEGFADLGGYGNIDLTINCPVNNIMSFIIADFDQSRPENLPLATKEELGYKVQLRHGWTCIFDHSLDVDKWVKTWKDMGINTLEYHSWIRAHDEIAPQGNSWNTYIGDDRLWTSKTKMKEKIAKFQAAGGRNICYTGIYAASPAFAYNHPDWVMRNYNSSDWLEYGNGYLYLMAANENVNSEYILNGKTFKNFNDYFVDQAILAQQEYNWDGWRWDWYGFPGQYSNPLLSAPGDFRYEIAALTDRLDTSVKNIRSDVTTTTLQLPNAEGNIPFNNTAAVVDHQFLELWPESNGTGDSYTHLYNEIYKAKSNYPDKPLFANFYPPLSMNLNTSWPVANIRYQSATCLMAGGFPAAQVVDGIAGFTDPLPFHATKYPTEVLTEISKWNRFCEAYGAYYYYSNEHYLIRDSKINPIVTSPSAGLVVKMKERKNKRTRQTDALIINMINYGDSPDLKWIEINNQPPAATVSIDFALPQGLALHKAYLLTPESKQEIQCTTLTNNSYRVDVDQLSWFASIVLSTNRCPELPPEPEPYSTTFEDYKFEYDTRGESLATASNEKITIIDEETPLVLKNYFDNRLSSWEISGEAYTGEQSISVKPGKLFFNSNSESAIRIPIDRYKKFRIAVKGGNASSAWFGVRLLNPSSSSPVWESRDLYYRIGKEQAGLQSVVLNSDNPPDEWTVYERNLLDDVKNHPSLTIFWQHAIVTGVFFGPVEDGNVLFDSFEFMTDAYNAIPNIKNQQPVVHIAIDPLDKKISVAGSDSSIQIKSLKLYNSTGNLQLLSKSDEIDTIAFPQGIYVLKIITDQGIFAEKIHIK